LLCSSRDPGFPRIESCSAGKQYPIVDVAKRIAAGVQAAMRKISAIVVWDPDLPAARAAEMLALHGQRGNSLERSVAAWAVHLAVPVLLPFRHCSTCAKRSSHVFL
jgi:hypothetical protein